MLHRMAHKSVNKKSESNGLDRRQYCGDPQRKRTRRLDGRIHRDTAAKPYGKLMCSVLCSHIIEEYTTQHGATAGRGTDLASVTIRVSVKLLDQGYYILFVDSTESSVETVLDIGTDMTGRENTSKV